MNDDCPKVSIITPSFNQAQFLEKTIKSVLGQNYSNMEYIIVDGGSSDDSISVIRRFGDQLAYWVSEKDNGQSHAINKGLSKATGEIVGWINSDDIYYPGALSSAVRFFEHHPEVDVIFSDYNFIDHSDHVIRTRKEIPFDFDTYLWTKRCYHANCAGFFRKRCFDTFGGLREDLHFGMDYELYLRFAKNGCKFMHVREVWGAYRVHHESKTTVAAEKGFADNNAVFRAYSSEYSYGRMRTLFLSSYYRSRRIARKLFSGCYT